MLALFSWAALSSFARQAAFLIVNLMLFERLSRPMYGALALGFAYRAVFAGLGECGIRQIAWREIARHRAKAGELTASFLGVKSLTAVAALGLYLGLMPLLWEPALPAAIFLLFGLGIVLNGGTFDFPLFGLDRMDLVARCSIAAYAIYLFGCLLWVQDDATAWFVPVLFVGAMGLLISLEVRWFQAEHGPLRLRFDAAGSILSQAWPIGVAETMHRLALAYPVILLGITAGSERVGDYRLGELGYVFLAHFGHLAGTATFSRVAAAFHQRRRALRALLTDLLGWVSLGALLAAMCFFIAGPPALALVFRQEIAAETSEVLRILALALVFAIPGRLLTALLAAVERQGMMLVASTITVCLGVTAGWIASSTHGIQGMASAVLATEVVRMVFLLWVYWRTVGPIAKRRSV
ncbi:MAG: oligosaccharide flippase family protein [Acidobacteriota bacterium]